jgi:ribulose 1,5-bisphosphate synthetase/thiazole synthase
MVGQGFTAEETARLTAITQPYKQQKSPVQLDIIVVGAGLSGLATAIGAALSGHHVTVFESAKELLEVSRARPADSVTGD